MAKRDTQDFVPQPASTTTSGLVVPPRVLVERRDARYRAATAAFENFKKALVPGERGAAFTTGLPTALAATGGGLDKPRDTPNFAFLRQMRKQSPIDQTIINIRMNQMLRVVKRSMNPRRQIGWRVTHKYADDPNFEVTDDIQARCLQMEAIIEMTLNDEWHPGGLPSVLMSMVEDHLVFDRRFMVFDASDRKGRPLGWHLLDAATIKPRIDILLPVMDNMAAQRGMSAVQVMAQPSLVEEATERASEQTQLDLTNKRWVQEVDGRVVAAWDKDEAAIDMVYTSTELNRWGYGFSMLEQSLWWSLAFVMAAQYNADLFKNNFPEAIMFLFGDYDPEGLEAFRKVVLQEQMQGANWRLPVIPADKDTQARVERLRNNPTEMQFPQWLTMLVNFKAANYRMHPSLVNFDSVRTTDVSLFQRGDDESTVTLSQEEGFHSLLDGVGRFITRGIVSKYYDDLMFRWVGLEPAVTYQELAQRLSWETPNEIRARDGELPPLAGEDAKYGDMLLNPTVITLKGLEQAQEQFEASLEMQAEMAEAQMEHEATETDDQQANEMTVAKTRVNPREAPPSAGGRNRRQNQQKKPTASSSNKTRKSWFEETLAARERILKGFAPLLPLERE